MDRRRLLAMAALMSMPSPAAHAQLPPPFGTEPKREANRNAITTRLMVYRPVAKTFGAAVVEYAGLAEGKGERGGNNAGPFVDWLTQTPPHVTPAWCAAFVSACWFFASYGLQRSPPWATWRYAPDGGIDPELWVPTLALTARNAGFLVTGRSANAMARARVIPGSVMLVPGSAPAWVHTGIVERVRGDVVDTIEGNVGASTSATGLDVVKRISRKFSSCDYGVAID